MRWHKRIGWDWEKIAERVRMKKFFAREELRYQAALKKLEKRQQGERKWNGFNG